MKFNTYFDNSATSFPKPLEVSKEISRYLNEIGGPYGRSSYSRAIKTARIIEETRELIANKLYTNKIDSIIFTSNATYALNTIINSFKNSHILISPMEHNAVIRPLKMLNIDYDILPHFNDGLIDITKIKENIKKNTSLIIINHVSNVNGIIQPIKEIKKIIGDIPLLVDGAQSFGHIPINIDKWNIDYFAFTGHKGLLGPTGTGGFFIKNSNTVKAFINGGTGSRSESFMQPDFLPDKFEAGTPNIAGIFGLFGSLTNFPKNRHDFKDLIYIIDELKKLNNIRIYCANNIKHQSEIFSFDHIKISCSKIYRILYEKFNIEARVGLHCSPLAHKTLNTFPNGTIRISPSIYHTKDELLKLLEIIKEINKL